MPCRPQSYNLLCIVSQGKTGHYFHISYKKICSPVAMLFLHVGKEKSGVQWDTDWAFGLCLASPCSPARLCQHHHRELGTGFTAEQLERTGIILLVKSQSTSPEHEEPLEYYSLIIHLIHIWGFPVSNHPGSSSKSCIKIGCSTAQFFSPARVQ